MVTLIASDLCWFKGRFHLHDQLSCKCVNIVLQNHGVVAS